MNFYIYAVLLTWSLYCKISPISTFNIDKEPKCAYENTVNLTNHHKYQNGSFLYQGKVIPPEILTLYDYAVLWGKNISVPVHVRGCICNKYPCIRLCCEKDEYFDEITNKCEKLRKDIVMISELRIEEVAGQFKVANIFNEFIVQIGLTCLESMSLSLIADNSILSQTGSLKTPYKSFESSEFCYSPRKTDISIYTLKPFTCLFVADNFEKKNLSKGTLTLMTFLTTSKNLKNIEVKGFITSLLFIIPTTVLYYFLKELRENLSDKLYFYYLYAITMSNIIFVFLNTMYLLWSGLWIIIMGFTGLILHIVAISWLSVFSFDIWRNCHTKTISKPFSIYCVSVSLYTCLASVSKIFEKLFKSYPVEIGEISYEILWWNDEKWLAPQITTPTVLILIFNCIKLIHMMVVLKVRRDSGTQNKNLLKKNAIIFLRLFLILVIPWFFKIFSLTIVNAVQGTMIFLASVLRRKVFILLKKKIKNSRMPKENVIYTETPE